MLTLMINRYLELYRSMGFKFRTQECLLRHFSVFAGKKGETYVRSETVLEWAKQAPSAAQKRNRLLTVRRFSIAMKAEDERYEIPHPNSIGHKSSERRIPRILSTEELKCLLIASSNLKPSNTIRPRTYSTLFALLAVSGLRISEALAFNLDDISDDGLIVRSTKFRKDRLVPVHKSTWEAIQNYINYRCHYGGTDHALFISNDRARLKYSTVNSTFLQLVRSTDLRDPPGCPGICIHDLRHRFAVMSLEACENDDVAISLHMTALSTYLGHSHISDTYWYLHATPSLMKKIASMQQKLFRSNNK